MGGDDALEVIHRAERIVWAAGWRLQEQTVLEQLAGTCGLGRARLEPRSDVIQLVTMTASTSGTCGEKIRTNHKQAGSLC
jgi:protein-disulfide isomerase-like protein with CxxC motif